MPSLAGESGTSLAGRRILVVEDEYFLADDMVRALATLGAEIVGPSDTAASALELVQSGLPIDGAVLDINLHGETSLAVASELRARKVPFVFATGYDQRGIPPEFADVPRWEKPFDPALLARKMPSLLDH
ncbi:response regulator [Enterovirga aerilata]|uniref:Response regulator n=1 Tax=Enterovirga aerilata TaxID=2730920 RepID=A0A849IG44_9HYPH|nr:response regulator [Enterovirga sp. DB1703]NNM75185.1 response regulator [Enterovirga sp. DB1703]